MVLLEKTGAGQFRGIDYGAIGGKLQLEAGIDLRDRKQDVLQEVLRWGDHRGDYRVVKAWVDHSAEALDWAADMLTNHGITIAPIPMEMQVIPDAWYEHYATDAFQIVPTDELIAEGGEAGYEPPSPSAGPRRSRPTRASSASMCDSTPRHCSSCRTRPERWPASSAKTKPA